MSKIEISTVVVLVSILITSCERKTIPCISTPMFFCYVHTKRNQKKLNRTLQAKHECSRIRCCVAAN